jgi:hypothetical protein
MSTSTENKSESSALDRFTAECLALPVSQWNPNVTAVFADRIEDAFYDKRKGRLVSIGGELEALIAQVMTTAPEAVRRGIANDKDGAGFREAFMLGCLSFAQEFVTSVARRRPDDEFYEEFNNDLTKKILVCLIPAESRTKAEISTSSGLALATLNAKIRELIGLGILEFRARFGNGEAGVAEYFLTPAAKQMLQEQSPG